MTIPTYFRHSHAAHSYNLLSIVYFAILIEPASLFDEPHAQEASSKNLKRKLTFRKRPGDLPDRPTFTFNISKRNKIALLACYSPCHMINPQATETYRAR